MKRTVKSFLGHIFSLLFPLLYRPGNIHIILMYHRVADSLPAGGFFDSGMYVTARSLENHIKQVKKYFQIVPLASILDPGQPVAGNCCAITFDDGWYDNYQFAFPVLKKHRVPASIFLPVNYIGTDRQFWFQLFWQASTSASTRGVLDDFIGELCSYLPGDVPRNQMTLKSLLVHLKGVPPAELDLLMQRMQEKYVAPGGAITRSTVNWDEAREMEAHDISFGSHGLSHHILPPLEGAQKEREIRESFEILKQKLPDFLPVFCYPNGDWDDECVQYVRESGYLGAVTTRLGTVSRRQDPFLLNRIGIHNDISSSSALFWFRIFQAIVADRKR